jgi:hypothetical protein
MVCGIRRALVGPVSLEMIVMSYIREPRHTKEEYEKYAPTEYRRIEIILKAAVYVAVPFAGIAIYAWFNEGNVSEVFFWVLGILLLLIIVAGILIQGMSGIMDISVDDAIAKEREVLHTKVSQMQNDIKSIEARVRDIKAKGHVVMAGAGSTVIIGSDISNSFNDMKKEDPVLAEAMATIAGAIEKSGNKDAGLAWTRFTKEVLGERDKTILSALWDKVVKHVPEIVNLVESAAKIATLVS